MVIKVQTHPARAVDKHQIPFQKIRFHEFIANGTEYRRVRQTSADFCRDQVASRIALAGKPAARSYRILHDRNPGVHSPDPAHQVAYAQVEFR
jgi:hypothetical protein